MMETPGLISLDYIGNTVISDILDVCKLWCRGGMSARYRGAS
jgi:hypothetical protein